MTDFHFHDTVTEEQIPHTHFLGGTVSALERLKDRTYVLQHNPNCPSPFLIRLPSTRTGRIDLLPYHLPKETNDRLFFGKTLDEAVAQALCEQTSSQ